MEKLKKIYKDLELINTDSRYEYYKCTTIVNKEQRILRILREESCSESYLKNLWKVRKAILSLNDDNLIKIYEIGKIDNTYFIEQEYLQADTLIDLFKKNISLSNEQCLEVIKDLCGGLRTFHDKGQIFRRIHPSNIFIDKNYRAKLDPLGYIDLDVNLKYKTYMSPEQSINGYIKTQSDIYTLGILLYEMIYRVRAIKINKEISLYDNILQGVDLNIKEVDDDIKYLISRMTKIKPASRHECLDDIITDIDTYIQCGEIKNKVVEIESKRVINNSKNNHNCDENTEYENVENIDFSMIPKVNEKRKYKKVISLIAVSLTICILGSTLVNSMRFMGRQLTKDTKETKKVVQAQQTNTSEDTVIDTEEEKSVEKQSFVQKLFSGIQLGSNSNANKPSKPNTSNPVKPEKPEKPVKPPVKPDTGGKPEEKPDVEKPEGGGSEEGKPEDGKPDGGNPEGGGSEGGNPDGEKPEEGNPDGEKPEGGGSEGENPEGETE